MRTAPGSAAAPALGHRKTRKQSGALGPAPFLQQADHQAALMHRSLGGAAKRCGLGFRPIPSCPFKLAMQVRPRVATLLQIKLPHCAFPPSTAFLSVTHSRCGAACGACAWGCVLSNRMMTEASQRGMAAAPLEMRERAPPQPKREHTEQRPGQTSWPRRRACACCCKSVLLLLRGRRLRGRGPCSWPCPPTHSLTQARAGGGQLLLLLLRWGGGAAGRRSSVPVMR